MGACSARPLLLEDWDTTRDKSLRSCQKLRTLGPDLEVPRAPTVWSVFPNPQTLGPPPVCPVQRQRSHGWDSWTWGLGSGCVARTVGCLSAPESLGKQHPQKERELLGEHYTGLKEHSSVYPSKCCAEARSDATEAGKRGGLKKTLRSEPKP